MGELRLGGLKALVCHTAQKMIGGLILSYIIPTCNCVCTFGVGSHSVCTP